MKAIDVRQGDIVQTPTGLLRAVLRVETTQWGSVWVYWQTVRKDRTFGAGQGKCLAVGFMRNRKLVERDGKTVPT